MDLKLDLGYPSGFSGTYKAPDQDENWNIHGSIKHIKLNYAPIESE